MANNGEVKLDTFNTETEALMVADLLRAEGIPSVLVPLGAGQSAFGASVWRPFEIRVRARDEERARGILAELGAKEAPDQADKEEKEEIDEDE